MIGFDGFVFQTYCDIVTAKFHQLTDSAEILETLKGMSQGLVNLLYQVSFVLFFLLIIVLIIFLSSRSPSRGGPSGLSSPCKGVGCFSRVFLWCFLLCSFSGSCSAC